MIWCTPDLRASLCAFIEPFLKRVTPKGVLWILPMTMSAVDGVLRTPAVVN
jgi:hypothetical protein